MNFEIIKNEQTPIIPKFEGDVKQYITENQDMLEKFLDFARRHDNAVGLAGNQVSLNGERFMHRVFALRHNYPAHNSTWVLVINPVIHEYLGVKRMMDEGCLTWGWSNAIIAERSPAIKASWYNMRGDLIENNIVRGFMAQVFQHEVNHLNGVEEKIMDIRNPKNELEVKAPILPKPRLDRNMPCPCNSGKKFKQCCIQWEN